MTKKQEVSKTIKRATKSAKPLSVSKATLRDLSPNAEDAQGGKRPFCPAPASAIATRKVMLRP